MGEEKDGGYFGAMSMGDRETTIAQYLEDLYCPFGKAFRGQKHVLNENMEAERLGAKLKM